MASFHQAKDVHDEEAVEADRRQQHCVIRPIPSKIVPQPHFLAPHYQWKAPPASWLPFLSYYDWMVAAASLSAVAAAASNIMPTAHPAAFPFPVESMTHTTNENTLTEERGRDESTSMDFDEDETISVENTDSEDSDDDLRCRSNVVVIETSTETETLDVAACDGPIRFQRIVNPATTESEEEEPPQARESRPDKRGGSSESSAASTTYRCLFCNHTFKSHYCYQKHKRRHLNPCAVDFEATTTEDDEAAAAEKRHPAIRDINVQFFPCKICGAKFPSYYFVHKHKKMWHSAELEEEKLRAGVASGSKSIAEAQTH